MGSRHSQSAVRKEYVVFLAIQFAFSTRLVFIVTLLQSPTFTLGSRRPVAIVKIERCLKRVIGTPNRLFILFDSQRMSVRQKEGL
jgi:hypothetical protein